MENNPAAANENQPPVKPTRRRPPPLPRIPSFAPLPPELDQNADGLQQTTSNHAAEPNPNEIQPVLVDHQGDWRAQLQQSQTPKNKILTPAELYADAKNRPKGQKQRRPYADRTRPKRIPSEIADKEANISEQRTKKKRTRQRHRRAA